MASEAPATSHVTASVSSSLASSSEEILPYRPQICPTHQVAFVPDVYGFSAVPVPLSESSSSESESASPVAVVKQLEERADSVDEVVVRSEDDGKVMVHVKPSATTTTHVHVHGHDRQLVGKRRSFWNTNCCCHFSCIPDEVMLFSVFTFLDQTDLCVAGLVCTRWRFLASDHMLWRELDLAAFESREKARVQRHLQAADASPLPRGGVVVRREFHMGDNPDAVAPRRFVTDHTLRLFLSRFASGIHSLKACNCVALTTGALLQAAPQLSALEALHLCNLSESVDDRVLAEIGQHSPRLRHLSMFGCRRITDEGVRAVSSRLAASLRELSIRGCAQLTDEALSELGPGLVELNAGGCAHLSPRACHIIAARSPALQRLNLHGVRVDDAGVHALSSGCPALSTLHLSSSNPFGGTSLITDASLFSLAKLRQLRCLNVQGSSAITNEGVTALAEHCGRLERLNLGGCYRVSDVGVRALAHARLPLTHLSLSQLFKLTDAAVADLAHGLPALVHLDLHSCVGISAAPLIDAFAAVAPIEDQALDYEDSDDADLALAQPLCWPHLAIIDVGSCRHISSADLAELAALRPHVNLVSI